MTLESLSNMLPYLGYEDEAMILKDGRICFFYEVDGVEYEGWKEEDYQAMVDLLEASLREMPLGTTLTKTDIYFRKQNQLKPINQSYIEAKRVEHFNKRKSLEHQSYIVLSFAHEKAQKPTPNSTILARKGKNLPAILLKGIQERIIKAKAKASEFYSLMNEMHGVTFRKMPLEEIKLSICRYLDLDFEKEQIDVSSEIEKKHNYLQVGNQIVSAISLYGQGETLMPFTERRYNDKGFINPYATSIHFPLQVPHIVTTTLTTVDMEKTLKPFKTEVLINKQLSGNSPLTRGSNDRALMVEQSIDEVRRRKDGFVELSVNILLFSDNYEEMQQSIEKTQQAIKSIYQAKYLKESWDIANIFFSSLPGNGWETVRTLMMPTKNALPYFHFQKPYISDDSGELLTDRFGRPTRVDLNRSDLTSKNRLIVGPTGSGKSFTEGVFISTAHERGEIQVIIDKGGSYKNLIKSLDGQYFEHKADSPMRFNPFATEMDPDGLYILSPDKKIVLVTFIKLLWKSTEHQEYLTKAENSLLLIWLEAYYDHLNEQKKLAANDEKIPVPTLRGFVYFIKTFHETKIKEKDAEYLRQKEFFNVNHFHTVMHPFIEGNYAEIFNAEDVLELSNYPLICFDLEGVQQDKTLYPIITMLVIELVFTHIAKFPDNLKHVILDEAWSFFTGEMAEFIALMYRTIRKNNGTATIITQSAQDILDSELANALIQNTQIYIILDHKGKSTEPLRKIGLEDFHIRKIESIRKHWFIDPKTGIKGGRELFIKREDKSYNIYAIEVPIEQYVLLTSHPPERNHFNKLQKKYPLSRAIEEWKRDKEAMVF
jgi:conjugal transfer ATP-binding protein TraC